MTPAEPAAEMASSFHPRSVQAPSRRWPCVDLPDVLAQPPPGALRRHDRVPEGPLPRAGQIADWLRQSGRELLVLSEQQVNEFAGNAMELMGKQGPVLAISTRALAALKPQQRRCIERTATIVDLSVPTIELAGGSVRCMLAGIHLSPRTAA